jgi:2-oxoglutarate/2-oxoacid ferredoxin oxidoreductase subunit alpha
MSEYQQAVITQPSPATFEIINNFSITFCTVNGSGSATANTTILRALFKMGIPVSGRNTFPSNIKGLPTWYTIRMNEKFYLGRTEKDQIVVAMNPVSFKDDIKRLAPGGVLIYSDEIAPEITRTDIYLYAIPAKQLVKELGINPSMRDYVMNMVYVGVISAILGIGMNYVRQSLDHHFKNKTSVVDSNYLVISTAYDWAKQNLIKRDPYFVRASHLTDGYILSDGNITAALGAIFGGIQFAAWYPITPASSIPETLHEYLPQYRKDENGKSTYAIIQAEDELASIGMCVGAGWAGLRALTATSGPGLSLMSEYIGLAYFAEIPLVIWNVQRVGPSTGLPTRTAQCDLTFCYYLGHGDTRYVMLFPSSLRECFEFGWQTLDLAERLQTPIQVLSDLDLGMNQWISEELQYPDKPMDRGKVLWEEELESFIQKNGKWGRYLDVDGDGIPYRTCMGNRSFNSSYFCRGTGHDEYAHYSEEPEIWEANTARLNKKHETARDFVPQSIIRQVSGAKLGMIAYGSTDVAVIEAQDTLMEYGLPIDYLRIRALPYNSEVRSFIENHEKVFVVELNDQGQMKQILTVEQPDLAIKLISVAHIDGLPITAEWITREILKMEGKNEI